MSKYLEFILILVTLIFGCITKNYGQQKIPSKWESQIAKADSEYAARSQEEKKLGEEAYQFLLLAEVADTSIEKQRELNELLSLKGAPIKDSQGRVEINIGIRPRSAVPSVIELIKSLGGVITFAPYNIGQVDCRIHLKLMRKLITHPGIVSIELAFPGLVLTNKIVSEGYYHLKVDSVQFNYSVYGDGIKIGVISDGVDDWEKVRDNFELPTITVLNAGSGNEGTAMLEIIHDIAPNANLYFCTAGSNYNSFGRAIYLLDSVGCDIIVDDISIINEPYFTDEDDTLGLQIRNFLWHGGTYISAAGNYNRSIYNDPQGYSINSGVTNIGPDNKNIFLNNQTFINCTVNPYSDLLIFFEWATSWKYPTSDYNIFAYDENDSLVSQGNLVQLQNGNINPKEKLFISNNTNTSKLYKIVIKFSSGDDTPVEFKLVCNYNFGILDINCTDNKHIYGHPGYSGVIGVAAYDAETQNQLAAYSSGGPLKMYSKKAEQWTEQQTPFITATSGVHTFVGTQGYWIDPFYGTSAAAPHIAAIAGLYFSKFQTYSRQNFMNDLKNGAIQIDSKGGNGNWDSIAGYGVANAMNLFLQASGKVASPIFDPPGGSSYVPPINVTIKSETQGAQIYYTTDGSNPTINSYLYSTPITLTSNTTINAIGLKDGLQPSDVSTANYQMLNLIKISQIDENGIPFGWFSVMRRDLSGWNYYYSSTDTLLFNLSGLSFIYVMAQQNIFKFGTTQKYNRWEAFDGDLYTENYARINLKSYSGYITAWFKSTYTTYLKASLENLIPVSLKLSFKDPWIIDSIGSYGQLNRGTKAIWYNNLNTPVTLDTASLYKGVFLNQNLTFDPNLPNYSIKANSVQDIYLSQTGRTHRLYFHNWSGTNANFQNANALETPVVFTLDTATAQANLKGTQLSNTINAYSNNSQRKVVKAYGDTLYTTYQSMGNIFLEKSTNNGVTWQFDYKGPNIYLNNNPAKSSSIDFVDTAHSPIL
ncbi:MAG: hypothetical protein STSR0008_09780 [Ignavibacterium sp.]